MKESGKDNMKIGFDNEKYLSMQSEHIRQRIDQFDHKLYLEFGGKLFDDYPRFPRSARICTRQQAEYAQAAQ